MAEQGANEGESVLKRICGLEGRDTITRHTLLDMKADDTWVGTSRRFSPHRSIKKEGQH
jgi:hypothetical protein